jgi:hypothetical protein
MNGKFGHHEGRIAIEPGVLQPLPRQEDGWSLANWSTVAVRPESWPRTPPSGRTSPADSHAGQKL